MEFTSPSTLRRGWAGHGARNLPSFTVTLSTWKGCCLGLTSCQAGQPTLPKTTAYSPRSSIFPHLPFFSLHFSTTNQLTLFPLSRILILLLLMCAGIHPNPGPQGPNQSVTFLQLNWSSQLQDRTSILFSQESG
jgi:hypothetical protein